MGLCAGVIELWGGGGEGKPNHEMQKELVFLNQQGGKGALARKQVSGKEGSGLCCRS